MLDTLGVVLPVLPMTLFILLAAWCFARSSSHLHAWLPYRLWFGNYLRFQQKHHATPCGAKPRAILLILIASMISPWSIQMPWVRTMLLIILACLPFYMWRILVIDEKQKKHQSTTIVVAIIVYSQHILVFSSTGADGQRLNDCCF